MLEYTILAEVGSEFVRDGSVRPQIFFNFNGVSRVYISRKKNISLVKFRPELRVLCGGGVSGGAPPRFVSRSGFGGLKRSETPGNVRVAFRDRLSRDRAAKEQNQKDHRIFFISGKNESTSNGHREHLLKSLMVSKIPTSVLISVKITPKKFPKSSLFNFLFLGSQSIIDCDFLNKKKM